MPTPDRLRRFLGTLLTLVLLYSSAALADLIVFADAHPLDLPASSQEREAFYSLLTGKGIPPQTQASKKPDSIAYLAETP